MNIVITGRSGRMGMAVTEAAEQHPEATVHGTHDAGEELLPLLDGADTVIDFTIHSFTPGLVESALATNTALVIGTTGHDEEELAAIRAASGKIPIVFAPNYSVGVNTLFWLTRQAARILGNDRFANSAGYLDRATVQFFISARRFFFLLQSATTASERFR